MRKQKGLIFGCLLAALCMLSGCGQKAPNADDANGRTVITVNFGKVSVFDACIEEFNEINPDYYVRNVDYSATDYRETYDTTALRMMTGRGTDIVYLSSDYRLPRYIEKGVLEDLTPYIERDIRQEDYLDGAFQLYATQEGTYAVPSVLDINILVKKCEQNSLYETIPFSKLCDMLEQKRPLSLIDRPALTTLWYLYFFFPFDVENTEELAKAIEIAEEYQRSEGQGMEFDRNFLVLDERISDPGLLLANYISFGKMGENISGVNEPIISGCPFGISSSSEEKEGAWEFILFLLQAEGQDAIEMDFAPVRKANFEAMCDQFFEAEDEITRKECERTGATREEFLQRYNEMLQRGIPRELMTDSYDIWRIIEEEVQMYYNGDRSMDETVEMIQNRVSLYRQENE